jgi:uncharacterized protein (DUF2062 family)
MERPAARWNDLLRRKLRDPIVQQLTQGLSPDTIALTVGVGLAIAVIPVIGVTTLLSFLAAWAFRLNQPVIQTINWSSAALQLLLIIPFIRLGEKIFHAPRMAHSLEDLAAMGKADPFGTLARLGSTVGHGVVAWLLVAPFIVAAAYFATRPAFRAMARRVAASRPKDATDVA